MLLDQNKKKALKITNKPKIKEYYFTLPFLGNKARTAQYSREFIN